MGRGSSTRETDVKKERPPFVASSQGTKGGKGEGQIDTCLFSFSGSFSVPQNDLGGIKQGDIVVIVPHASDTSAVEVYINGKNFGKFNSRYTQNVLECTSKGYTYEGTVDSITMTATITRIKFSIHGYAR